MSLLRSRGVAIPSAVQAFFSSPTDLRTIASVVVSTGHWADTLGSLCADPNAPIDGKPKPPIEARRFTRRTADPTVADDDVHWGLSSVPSPNDLVPQAPPCIGGHRPVSGGDGDVEELDGDARCGHDSRRRLRAGLMGHMPALPTATITFASPEDGSVFEVLSGVQGHDHGHRRRRPPITFQQLQIQTNLGYTVFASGNQFKRLFANSLSLTRSPDAPVVARNAG